MIRLAPSGASHKHKNGMRPGVSIWQARKRRSGLTSGLLTRQQASEEARLGATNMEKTSSRSTTGSKSGTARETLRKEKNSIELSVDD